MDTHGQTKAILFAQGLAIGDAVLAVGDETMGGVMGLFYPNEHYIAAIQPLVWRFWDEYPADLHAFFGRQLQLAVQLENGIWLTPLGGIELEDFADDEAVKRLEMSGVDTAVIERYIAPKLPTGHTP